MPGYEQLDLRNISLISIARRKSKVAPKDFARVVKGGRTPLAEFIRSFPRILAANEMRDLVEDIVRARRRRKPARETPCGSASRSIRANAPSFLT